MNYSIIIIIIIIIMYSMWKQTENKSEHKLSCELAHTWHQQHPICVYNRQLEQSQLVSSYTHLQPSCNNNDAAGELHVIYMVWPHQEMDNPWTSIEGQSDHVRSSKKPILYLLIIWANSPLNLFTVSYKMQSSFSRFHRLFFPRKSVSKSQGGIGVSRASQSAFAAVPLLLLLPLLLLWHNT